MRLLAILSLLIVSCAAQSGEAKVEAVLRQMERAEQTGDFNAFAAVWSREKSGDLEKMRPYVSPRPERHYRAIKVFVHGDEAALLAQAAADSFVSMTLRREDGQWKILDQVWRNTAPEPNSVYALVLPEPGAFARAGSPWDQIAPAMDPGEAARLGWQMRPVFDEAYLYLRIKSSAALPAPGSTTDKPPGGWPILKIAASGAGEFVLYDSVNIADQAEPASAGPCCVPNSRAPGRKSNGGTFDEHGNANSHRPYAGYMMRLERNDHEVFSASADLHPSPLIEVTGRYLDMRIPLRTMGIVDSRTAKLTVGDTQWPKSVVMSAEVRRYTR